MITQAQIDACVEVAKKYGATRVLLFGSAKDDPARARDIDLICAGVRGVRLLSMAARMEREAWAPVDIVAATPRTPFVDMNVEHARVLYE